MINVIKSKIKIKKVCNPYMNEYHLKTKRKNKLYILLNKIA